MRQDEAQLGLRCAKMAPREAFCEISRKDGWREDGGGMEDAPAAGTQREAHGGEFLINF